jgi:hypothetical protein
MSAGLRTPFGKLKLGSPSRNAVPAKCKVRRGLGRRVDEQFGDNLALARRLLAAPSRPGCRFNHSVPFGGGVRRCIGMAFAQFEMKVVLSGILSDYELALADTRPVRLVRRGLTAAPSPFRMVMKARRPTQPVSRSHGVPLNS